MRQGIATEKLPSRMARSILFSPTVPASHGQGIVLGKCRCAHFLVCNSNSCVVYDLSQPYVSGANVQRRSATSHDELRLRCAYAPTCSALCVLLILNLRIKFWLGRRSLIVTGLVFWSPADHIQNKWTKIQLVWNTKPMVAFHNICCFYVFNQSFH